MSIPTPVPPPPVPPPPRRGVRPSSSSTSSRPAVDRRVAGLGALGLVLAVLVGLVLFLPDDGPGAGAPTEAMASGAATPTGDVTARQPTDMAAETPAADAISAEELQAELDALFAELVRRDPADPMALGAVDAPVVMIMWADFRCGYCARFALETAPGLAGYVADGSLRIEWRDFPRVTEQSPAIAAAARAAGLQGSFWEFHDRVFADQATVDVMGDEYLRAVADDLGLDVARFDVDRASEAVLAAVEADSAEGQAIGVSGTPAFLVNGSPITGSQPLETYLTTIEAELARAVG